MRVVPRPLQFVVVFVIMQAISVHSGVGAPVQQPYALPTQRNYLHRKFPAFIKTYDDAQTYEPTQDVTQVTDGTQNSEIKLLPGDQYKKQVKCATDPTRIQAIGFAHPTGPYRWDGRAGVLPEPTMAMPGYTTPFSVPDSGYVGPYMSMLDTVDPSHGLRTTTITNMEFTALQSARSLLCNELRQEPQRLRQAMNWGQEAKQSIQGATNATAAEQNLNAAWATTAAALINIANEEAWTACSSEAPLKSYSNAAWMAGQMYKRVYIPMAILLLLPGALLTQLKFIIRHGFVPTSNPFQPDADTPSPFPGILRSMIAIVLIPATQLIVSYTIDVGNSLTYEIVTSPYWDIGLLESWRDQQTFDPKYPNETNHVINTPIPETVPDLDGKARDKTEDATRWEQQNYETSTAQNWFNTLASVLGQGVVALNAFQLVIIMYLFLLGPVAAALWAWPTINASDGMAFRWVFSRWMDGVVLVTMWKFWWAMIMLAMMVRLEVNDANYWSNAAYKNWNDQFEMYFAGAFFGMLLYVPFNPFEFSPGDAVSSVLDQAQQATPKGGGTAGVTAGGDGPAGGNSGEGLGGQQGSPGGPGGSA